MIMSDTEISDIECGDCHENFAVYGQLTDHIKSLHQGTHTNYCSIPECDEVNVENDHYIAHLTEKGVAPWWIKEKESLVLSEHQIDVEDLLNMELNKKEYKVILARIKGLTPENLNEYLFNESDTIKINLDYKERLLSETRAQLAQNGAEHEETEAMDEQYYNKLKKNYALNVKVSKLLNDELETLTREKRKLWLAKEALIDANLKLDGI